MSRDRGVSVCVCMYVRAGVRVRACVSVYVGGFQSGTVSASSCYHELSLHGAPEGFPTVPLTNGNRVVKHDWSFQCCE